MVNGGLRIVNYEWAMIIPALQSGNNGNKYFHFG